MYSNKIESYKKGLRLTKAQKEIIVGTLLGDGHLETSNHGRTYRLKIEHSIKQKEYTDWIFNQFKLWTNKKPRTWKRYSQLPNGSMLVSQKYGFSTYSHGAFRFFGQQFYPKNGRKIIPKIIESLLAPLSIAIWYLDDGSFKSERHKTFIIHTHGYKKNDLKKAQKALKRYEINTKLHMQKRRSGIYWRIYVLSESAPRFRKIVKPIVNQIPSMKYKLGNKLPKR